MPRPVPSSAVRSITVLVATLLATVGLIGPASAAAPPSSMASLGDSITRAFDSCGWFVDCPSRSWSTGTESSVNSHYLRIRALNGSIDGKNYNDAKSGAVAADLAGQATTAVGQGVQYVTVLVGANDACKSSESAMTPVATFRTQVDAGLNTLTSGLPNAQILVVSIPDLRRLWEVGHTSVAARTVWSVAGICQAMLANSSSTSSADTARRARVRDRVIAYNGQLAASCAARPNCKFDNNAVFNYPFAFSQVSGWDYFHPNTAGQAVLSQVSWDAGYRW